MIQRGLQLLRGLLVPRRGRPGDVPTDAAWLYCDDKTGRLRYRSSEGDLGLVDSADRRLATSGHAGAPVNTGATANLWYGAGVVMYSTTAISNVSYSANGWRVMPVTQVGDRTIDAVYMNVTTSAVGGKILVAIYADNGAGYPGALVASTELDASSTGQKKTTGLSWTLSQGTKYWVAVNFKATVSAKGIPAACIMGGAWNESNTTGSCGWFLTETYSSTAPSTFSASGTLAQPLSNTVPGVWLRYAA